MESVLAFGLGDGHGAGRGAGCRCCTKPLARSVEGAEGQAGSPPLRIFALAHAVTAGSGNRLSHKLRTQLDKISSAHNFGLLKLGRSPRSNCELRHPQDAGTFLNPQALPACKGRQLRFRTDKRWVRGEGSAQPPFAWPPGPQLSPRSCRHVPSSAGAGLRPQLARSPS